MKCTCLNCGHEFEPKEICLDDLGWYTACPECGGSFDIDPDDRPVKPFRLIYDTESFIDGIDFGTFEEAKDAAYTILLSWMNDCSMESGEEWNMMIENCSVWVERYESFDYAEGGDYYIYWQPDDAYLESIGWKQTAV